MSFPSTEQLQEMAARDAVVEDPPVDSWWWIATDSLGGREPGADLFLCDRVSGTTRLWVESYPYDGLLRDFEPDDGRSRRVMTDVCGMLERVDHGWDPIN